MAVSSTRSTFLPNRSSNWNFISMRSIKFQVSPGMKETRISTSLPEEKSSRVADPKRESCHLPAGTEFIECWFGNWNPNFTCGHHLLTTQDNWNNSPAPLNELDSTSHSLTIDRVEELWLTDILIDLKTKSERFHWEKFANALDPPLRNRRLPCTRIVGNSWRL